MSYFKMSKLALRSVFTRPPTSRYPFEPRKPSAQSRGQLVFTKATCVFCTVCAKKCPTGALSVNRAQKKWAIDRLLCISCGNCVEACPKKSISLAEAHGVPVLTKDREVH